MSKTITVLFDQLDHAQAARRDLIATGIKPDMITLSHEGGKVAELHGSFWSSLKGFLGSEDYSAYEEAGRRGGVLLRAEVPDSSVDRAAEIGRRNGAINLKERVEEFRQSGWKPSEPVQAASVRTETAKPATPRPQAAAPLVTPPAARAAAPRESESETVIPVVREELKVGKRTVEDRGGVRIYSHTVSEPVERQIELTDEQTRIERRPVSRPAGEGEFRDRILESRELHEEAVVQKEAHVVEEVTLGKDVKKHTETVHETLRHTEVDVQRLDDEFRKDYQTKYANKGLSFEQMRPAYSFGQQIAGDDRFRNKSWNDIESDLQRDFEARYPGQWQPMHDAIHSGYDFANRGHA